MISTKEILKIGGKKNKKSILFLQRLRALYQIERDRHALQLRKIGATNENLHWIDTRKYYTQEEIIECIENFNIDSSKNNKKWWQFWLNDTEALVYNSLKKINDKRIKISKIRLPRF